MSASPAITITTKHPESRFGVPVILDASGNILDNQTGVLAAMDLLDWSRSDLSKALGLSPRSIEGYFGRHARYDFTAAQLNVLADALSNLEPLAP